jgi:hypothetical protein
MKKIKNAATAIKLIGTLTYYVVHPDNNKFAKDVAKIDSRYAK